MRGGRTARVSTCQWRSAVLSAGQVIEAGPGVDDLGPGDLVACGGAGLANHAEVICVPRLHCVLVLHGVEPRHAAVSILGAIALQSVRVADSRLGDAVVVIGFGLVGLLLRADPARGWLSGVRHRCGSAPGGRGQEAWLLRSRAGHSRQPAGTPESVRRRIRRGCSHCDGRDRRRPAVAIADELARTKGRVLVVGEHADACASRETYLFKELELRTSMACGPGTGDPSYEEWGIDYPQAYVRWTENRNMEAFLDLLARERVDVAGLISREFPVEAARKRSHSPLRIPRNRRPASCYDIRSAIHRSARRSC